MVFSSVVFIFYFLPVVLLLYQLAWNNKLRNFFLLIASLTFYSWGEGAFVCIMLFSILINYLAGIHVDRFREKNRKLAWIITTIAITINLGLLAVFKYSNFIVDNLNPLLKGIGIGSIELNSIHLPIGISFFTFQAMSYVIDVYRGKTGAQKNPVGIGLYISLFPQLIAGPIIRYHDVARQIVERVRNCQDVSYGIQRFVFGLGKKVLIANPLALVVDEIFQSAEAFNLSPSLAWLGIVCYSLQIYFDFSGYSDMAIGLGRMFGFRYLENFNYPYISLSIQEFWRRWHISLSNWFKDYLYIPLGGNRKGLLKTYRNLLVVFCLCGLWHGASWNFLIWGLLHGFFIVLERCGFGDLLEKLYKPIRLSYTLLVVLIAWVFFRASDLSVAMFYLKMMAGLAESEGVVYHVSYYLDKQIIWTLIAGGLFSMPVYPFLRTFKEKLCGCGRGVGRFSVLNLIEWPKLAVIMAIFVFSMCFLASNSYNPFIYFRF